MIDEIVSVVFPVFVSVTDCVVPTTCPAHVRDDVDRLGSAPLDPVPLRLTVAGDNGSLLASDSVAVSAPMIDGVNVTLTVQVPRGAIVCPTPPITQVSALIEKSAEFVPLSAAVVKVRLRFPALVTVTVWAALVTPVP